MSEVSSCERLDGLVLPIVATKSKSRLGANCGQGLSEEKGKNKITNKMITQ